MEHTENIITTLNQLFNRYPGYLFKFDDFPSIIILYIKSKSSGLVFQDSIAKNNISLIDRTIERMINKMREEELKLGSRRIAKAYSENDARVLSDVYRNKYSITPKEIIFQDEKTTIINWNDGTKTVVKCSDGDTFSPEAGVALCYMKRFIVDNDPERFHRLLKSLIVDISKVKYSKEAKNDLDTGTPDNAGDNNSDNTSMEVVS